MAQQFFSRQTLSNASNGVILGISSASPTVIHQGSGLGDELWLYAANSGSSLNNINIMWGQTSPGTSGSRITTPLSIDSGLTLIIPGLLLTPNLYVTGYTNFVNSVIVYGFVNRLSSTL